MNVARWIGREHALRRVAAAAVFAARANLRSGMARVAAAFFLTIVVLGEILARTRGGATDGGDRLVGYAFIVSFVFLLRSGLAEQRSRGFDLFLRKNFISPAQQAWAGAAALVLQLGVFCTLACTAIILISLGDVRHGGWYAAVFFLSAALFLPVVLLVEMVSEFRLPFVLVPLGLTIVLAVADPLVGAERVIGLLGLEFSKYGPATLLPLAMRVAVVLPITFLLLSLLYASKHRPHD